MAACGAGGRVRCGALAGGSVGRMNDILTLENVTLSYDRHPAVHHVSGGFKAGSLTAIVGPNGAGKSTLLKALAGMVAPESGQMHLHGCAAKDVVYLPQSSEIQRDFPMTVLQMVASGHWQRCGNLGAIDGRMRDQARAAMAAVGLVDFDKRAVGTLSAGQFQRALFARLIVQDARLILLDEPFNAIDEETCAKLVEIMLGWHAQARTVICVLHDAHMVERYFPQALLLARECVAWGDTQHVMTAANRQRARFFNGAWAEHADLCEAI